jgi:hypothetical protein
VNRIVDLLNRLLALHSRSLPMYLASARPFTKPGDERALETLGHIVDDQRLMVDRIAEVISEEGGTALSGEYPMEFTNLHDLSMEFLIQRVLERQRQDLTTIEQLARQLEGYPRAFAVTREALGAAQGHLDSLEELSAAPAG